jgi:hypothetical protein
MVGAASVRKTGRIAALDLPNPSISDLHPAPAKGHPASIGGEHQVAGQEQGRVRFHELKHEWRKAVKPE